MAAGLGSRYGGSKQVDGIGPNNEILMEYSIYDALRAGFNKVVFIIKPEMEPLMERICGEYLRRRTALDGTPVEVAYVHQDFSSVPDFYQIPVERTKPFGTVHALLCAAQAVHEPFCVINADDYYGIDAYRAIYDELATLPESGRGAMIEMPKFVGCLFAGAIARNVMETFHIKFYVPEVDAIEHMFLELYLALVLMTIDITKLAPVAGQMGVILLAQAILMALFGIFISYNMFGRNYGAAVMTAGNCGWGCGSGPNAVANEKAVMDQYGWHNVAWVLYPSFAVIIDDIFNPIFLSLYGSFLVR